MAQAAEGGMSARDLVLAAIRRSLGVAGAEAPRQREVADRLAGHPPGVVPARGHLPANERIELFATMVTAAAGTVARVGELADVPAEVAAFLRRHNLPLAARRGADPMLATCPWDREPALTISQQAGDGVELASISHAFAAVAETGTLILNSGPDNPTTLNFLPDNHIVVVEACTIAGDYETVVARLREKFGIGHMPRTVNMITGPSRSADIEQTLILGAHGPRRLHVVILGSAVEDAGNP
jgi:L-lactate dehydrogenase complex protein LldG